MSTPPRVPAMGDGHDPGDEEKRHPLEVDGLEGAVAETDTDGCASDAHGG